MRGQVGSLMCDMCWCGLFACVISLSNLHRKVGGGVMIVGANVTMQDTIVSGNQAAMGGGIWVESYGSFASNLAAAVALLNCEITDNRAEVPGKTNGGGLYINQTWVGASEPSVAAVGCSFEDNKSGEVADLAVGNDVVVGRGANFGVFSACPEEQFNAGSGLLLCEPLEACGEGSPANLQAGACGDCPADSYSCCGATSCVAGAQPDCTSVEDHICNLV